MIRAAGRNQQKRGTKSRSNDARPEEKFSEIHNKRIIQDAATLLWGNTLPVDFYSITASSSSSGTVAKLVAESLIA